ncbi:MAG TPA: TIGR03435 family protein [Vicinamibacterales bacterium]|jgi:uncharacterized protein (TIGR03435 family)|nr:TIGR03435 family protein [Vicinamibacterales bacterium]
MRRRGVVVAGVVVVLALAPGVRVRAQSAAAVPHFEVASIKSAVSPYEAGRAAGAGGGRVSFPFFGVRVQPGGRLIAVANLQALILRAYGIREYQIEGGPTWLTTDYFDIAAKAESEAATEAEMNEMLKSLLAERFGLRVHMETRQATVFTLKARADGRLGPGLKRTSPECEATLEEQKRTGARPPMPSGPPIPLTPICGLTRMSVARTGAAAFAMGGFPMSALAERISSELGAPVVDSTGLTGLFDLALEYESSRRMAGPGAGPDLNSADPLPVPLPAAVQQQLGLTLEKGTGPLSITIIDAADLPTPN